MAQAPPVERTIDHVVSLRRAGSAVADPRERRRLKQVERELQRAIGVGVPKRRAAAALGVSVTALDKWIARGRLPVVRGPGSSREQIDADALLDLAEEVVRAREEGQKRSLLATAFERLATQGRPRPKLRPNQPARELREHYLKTTPDDRVREVAELSRVLTGLAVRGADGERGGMNGDPEALDFYGLVRTLLEHSAEFVLIGGFALGFQGVPRGTNDVDIVPDPSPANIARLGEALKSLDAAPIEHIDPEFKGASGAFDTRLGRLDLMAEVAGVEGYQELRAHAVTAKLPELDRPIWIAGRDDLVTMKQEAGRPQDLIDVQALRMAEGLEE